MVQSGITKETNEKTDNNNHSLICAGTAWYGVPTLILEAVRRTGSSCYHNGGTL